MAELSFLTDDEFVTAMRARFASKPYSSPGSDYWTDERYEALILDLLGRYRSIRDAATMETPLQQSDDVDDRAFDKRCADWGVWSITHHDVGAYPTPWHRIYCALEQCASLARSHERRKIAKALHQDVSQRLGPTTMDLVASVIEEQND